MGIDILLIIVAIVLLVVGFFGTFVPVLPGAPLAWFGLLAAFFSSYVKMSVVTLIICAVIAIFVSVADNIFPVAMTKQSGGSKAGTWGSTIGLVVGLFTGPWGILIGPFIGALIGEMVNDSSDMKKCLKAAFGAFKGFLLGTGLKMIAVAIFIWIFVACLLGGLKINKEQIESDSRTTTIEQVQKI